MSDEASRLMCIGFRQGDEDALKDPIPENPFPDKMSLEYGCWEFSVVDKLLEVVTVGSRWRDKNNVSREYVVLEVRELEHMSMLEEIEVDVLGADEVKRTINLWDFQANHVRVQNEKEVA